MTPAEIASANTAAARALVAGLTHAGVSNVCISPGSRSTPLTVAFAEQQAIRPWLHLDERSAGYFALGMARASGRPVALLCTSGTAAANYWPAVAEASLSRVPLVVLTTDRPPSLRATGAAQTIDQAGMFGSSARLALDLPLPAGDSASTNRFRAYAMRAVSAAAGPLPGPAHLNVPFDEPLLAAPADHPAAVATTGTVPVGTTRIPPAGDDIRAAVAALTVARRPLVVAGPETGGLPATEIMMLARVAGAPVLADPLSGLRAGPHPRDGIAVAYDALLTDAAIADALAPDAVVQFGAAPTSKGLNQLLARIRGVPFVLCDLPGGYRDPNAVATHVVSGDPAFVAEALAAEWRGRAEPGWCDRWVAADAAAWEAMRSAACRFAEPFEGRLFLEIESLLPEGATIVAGNSMPVRDMDSFIGQSKRALRFVSNRGANGIDGVTSSALGAAATKNGPVVLVIGDISFYHDMNGLWAARRHELDMVVVLVNNDGGGIFHFLPQNAHAGFFEEWFGTPSGLDFAHTAGLYGATHTRPADWDAFGHAVEGGVAAGGLHIVELRTDRARNVEMHRGAWASATAAARQALAL